MENRLPLYKHMSKINVNNGRQILVSLYDTGTAYPTHLKFINERGEETDLRESELVSLYNLVRYAYEHGVSLEKILVYSNIFDEIDELSWKKGD